MDQSVSPKLLIMVSKIDEAASALKSFVDAASEKEANADTVILFRLPQVVKSLQALWDATVEAHSDWYQLYPDECDPSVEKLYDARVFVISELLDAFDNLVENSSENPTLATSKPTIIVMDTESRYIQGWATHHKAALSITP